MSRFDAADAFDIAQRFINIKEVAGAVSNPQILAMLKLDPGGSWVEDDETPWCSAFTNYVCWICRLKRSKSLRARSWLEVGFGVHIDDAMLGDIVVLQRGSGIQPGPEVINAPGHVGFYAGRFGGFIEVLGGNQADTVKVSSYPVERLLSIRRIDA